MSTIPIVGGLILALCALAFMQTHPFSLAQDQWIYLILLGAVVMPIANLLLIRGPRYITSAEVSMFLLLETILAPIWVWLVVAEKPSENSLIGGAIILTALVAHSAYKLRLQTQTIKTTL